MGMSVELMASKFEQIPPSQRVREIADLRAQGATMEQIARQLGTAVRNIYRTLDQYELRLYRAGYSPEHDAQGTAPPGFVSKGKSMLIDNRTGEQVLTWYKTAQDREAQLEAMLAAIEGACEGIKPVKPIARPKRAEKGLATLYHFTDYHLAMYAWSGECGPGNNWSTEIARGMFAGGLQELMASSPDSEVGIFSNGGDFCHWDGWEQITPTSRHILDADTRFPVLVETALDMHLYAIDQLLRKHRRVKVIIQEGNHDMASSVWLRKAIKRMFEKNGRVEIDDTEAPFYGHLHGRQFLGFHHGHKVSNKQLPALFASDPIFRPLWGLADYCYIHVGHFHKRELLLDEYGGAHVERHPTLAARDAYATRHGYYSRRAVNAITYDEEDGEICRRTTVPPRK